MKTIKFLFFVILLLSTAGLSGCAKSDDVRIGADQNHETVEVKIGDVLAIELPANPSTGYASEVENLDTVILAQEGEVEFKQEKSDESLVGAPGTQIMRIKAVAAGKTALKIIYHRSFEQGVDPLDTFYLNVVVK